MNEMGECLSKKQLQVIPILLSDPCVERACKKANIGKTTYYNWLNEKEFRGEFKKQQQAIFGSAIDKLKISFNRAVDELYALFGSENEYIRLRASEKIIEFNLNIEELRVLEKRIETLEEKAHENKSY